MQIIIEKLDISPENLIKKCGYIEITNPHNGENSFARSIHAGRFYPRFHVYLEKKNGKQILSIHMDAKKPIYKGTTAHSGEYDTPIVKEELERIQLMMNKNKETADSKPLGFKKKSWWEKLLGL